MINRRTVLGLLASASVIAPAGLAFAKQHHHKNGKDLLGAKLKQNGKHNVDKIGNAPVSAEVNNGKVVAMSATDPKKGPLSVRKVKSSKKMAEGASGILKVSASGESAQLAQDYGRCRTPCRGQASASPSTDAACMASRKPASSDRDSRRLSFHPPRPRNRRHA